MRNSLPAIKLGAFYAASIFLVGFALGTLRVLVIAPRFGELLAVLIELPIILGLSWVVFGWLARRHNPPLSSARCMISITAFVVLIGLEALSAAFVTDGGVMAFIANWLTLAGALGLAGQVGFALIPRLHPAARN
ncbi:MAG: hypothetical protein DHS20C06_15610 [Hyphobacterium sp.]|nr:MAG: hypothetical protein DHS20C06_15610 [Hyphobacterium sp.]